MEKPSLTEILSTVRHAPELGMYAVRLSLANVINRLGQVVEEAQDVWDDGRTD